MHQCPKCLKVFDKKFWLTEHSIQNTCSRNISIFHRKPIFDEPSFKCPWCEKKFTTKQNLLVHLSNTETKCFLKKKATMKEDMYMNELKIIKDTIGDLKESVSNIEKKGIGNITNNLNNVIIVKPGEECIKHITKDVMLKLLGNYSFIDFSCELVKVTYFNRQVKKNCGWCIVYPTNKKAGVEYNHELCNFERKSTEDIIDDKFANLLSLLHPLIEEINKEDEIHDNLNMYQKRNIKEFFIHYGMTRISQSAPKLYEEIHDVAYNFKTIPMESWRNQGLNANHLAIKFH